MYEGFRIGGLLLMGGEGKRFGGEIPKQFHSLNGKKIYLHTLERFLEAQIFDEVVLACHPDWIDSVTAEIPSQVRVVEGGKTRQDSSYQGILSLKNCVDILLIHDAVRPFVTLDILQENVRLAIQHGAVDTCIPSADTLVYAPGGETIQTIPNRSEYLRGQTPQTFRYDWILQAHEKARNEGIGNASDDCRLVLESGKRIQVAKGHESNLKITSEFDLELAELLRIKSLVLNSLNNT